MLLISRFSINSLLKFTDLEKVKAFKHIFIGNIYFFLDLYLKTVLKQYNGRIIHDFKDIRIM
jgi:hypothetical protein